MLYDCTLMEKKIKIKKKKKNKKALVLKGIFSETKYVCVISVF